MRERAQALLASLGIDKPPVDVESIAESLDFLVLYFPFPDSQSGAMFIEGDTKTIGVNKWHAETRQRFTIAHELGHYLGGHEDFHALEKVSRSEGVPRWADPEHQNEREADIFAAELLMPESMLREDVRTREYDLDALAKRYGVSQQAMIIQISDLGLVNALRSVSR